MNFAMLEMSLPLPLAHARHSSDFNTATMDRPMIMQEPEYQGFLSPDSLRYEYYLWLISELHPEVPASLPFPWTDILFIKGVLGRAFGRLTILLATRTNLPSTYAELYDIHIALDGRHKTDPVRQIYPHVSQGGPTVVVLRNSEIPIRGEHCFFNRNKMPLLVAAITTMKCRWNAPVHEPFCTVERELEEWQGLYSHFAFPAHVPNLPRGHS